MLGKGSYKKEVDFVRAPPIEGVGMGYVLDRERKFVRLKETKTDRTSDMY